MANYYTDHPEYDFYLNHPEMQRVVELKERNYADKDKFEDAPVDFEDAIENYKRVLEITGDIAANIIEPNSEDVDLEGPHLVDGRMHYASKTYDNIEATRQAGLWGISMPRRYNGLNMPITPYSMASEIVSCADAGFQNIWSLQDCIETLYEFGSEEQRQKYIPRVCAGETMSMDLTEPDAGSDLQRVMLKATQDEDGTWRLNGVSVSSPTAILTFTSCLHVLRKAHATVAVCRCSSTTSATVALLFVTSSTSLVSMAHLHASLYTRTPRQSFVVPHVWDSSSTSWLL